MTTTTANPFSSQLPKPIKFGRKSLWLKTEVEEWLWQRIIESRGGVK